MLYFNICSYVIPKVMNYEETHSKSTSSKDGLSKSQEEFKTLREMGVGR